MISKFRSIRLKIFFTGIVGLIVFTLFFVSTSTMLTNRIFKDVIYDSQMNYVRLYSLASTSWLDERMRDIETYSRNNIVRGMNIDEIYPLLIKEMKDKSKIYRILFVADRQGNYISNQDYNAGNLGSRDYFHRVMNGEKIIEGPLISLSTGSKIIVVAAPVRNDNGDVIGLMGGSIEIETLSDYILTFNKNIPNSITYIVDSEGLIISHPNSLLSMKESIKKSSKYISNGLLEKSDEILQSTEGMVEYTIDGASKFAYFSKMPYNDWTVITEIPINQIKYPINQLSLFLSIIGAFIFLVGIIVSLIVSRNNAKPIIELENAFRKAAAGNMSVRTYIESQDEIGEAGKSFNILMDKLSELTYYDPITKLPNRNALLEHLNVFSSISEGERHAAFLTISIDQFDSILQQYELGTVDMLLQSLSTRLRSYTNLYSRLFKLNGDEFILFISAMHSQAQIIEVGEKIIEDIGKPFSIGEEQVHITSSIGIAFYPKEGKDLEGILKSSSIARLRAKELGGNQYHFYNDKMNAELSEKFELAKDLHLALEKGEFFLEYQPFMDVNTGKIVQGEALIRWLHPTKGILYPNKFIEIAEKNNLIIPIGNWVLREACKQNKAWQDLGYRHIVVSVNISVLQFERADFVQTVKKVLNEANLSPEYLELEITESIAMKNIHKYKEKMNELRELGVSIAIDDFGTGFSSLNYLVELPIDILKIDRSFIKDIETSEHAKIVISTIISMSKVLKMDIVAEGVETLEQFNFIKNAQCSKVQGYFISRPINIDSFERLLSEDGFLIEGVEENA